MTDRCLIGYDVIRQCFNNTALYIINSFKEEKKWTIYWRE